MIREIYFNVSATDFNLKKNIFEIDMPPSFLLRRIAIVWTFVIFYDEMINLSI